MEIEEAIIKELEELGVPIEPYGRSISTYVSSKYFISDRAYSLSFDGIIISARVYSNKKISDAEFDISNPSFTVQKLANFISSSLKNG